MSQSNSQDFGDRMKFYEQAEAGRKAMPMLPVLVRLDGKGFSKYTKGLERPYDQRLSDIMVEVTRTIVEDTCACVGYTQSDEISLVYYSDDRESQVFFDGKLQKMCSVLASMATAKFNELAKAKFPDKPLAFFDCRVWTVPNLAEAANTFLWRELDASKNSISMAARHYYSHNELNNKNGAEMQEMLFQKGVNWNDYPSFFKRGTFIQRRKRLRTMSEAELSDIPEKFRPTAPVERTEVVQIDMPPFVKVTNRVGVIFMGSDPMIASHEVVRS